MTLERPVLLLYLLLLVVLLRLIKNKKRRGKKAGDFKRIEIFNAEKIQQINSSLGVAVVLQVS